MLTYFNLRAQLTPCSPSIVTVATAVTATFLIVSLGATGAQLALIMLSLLCVSGLSASMVAASCRLASRKLGDAHSGHAPLVCALAYLVVVTYGAPVMLRGPDDLGLAYLFGAAWGLGFGFYYSLLRPVFFFIVPGGQEAKFSGLFTFSQVSAFSLCRSLVLKPVPARLLHLGPPKPS